MNKTTIAAAAAAVAALGALVWIAKPGPGTSAAPTSANRSGALKAEEASFDFGAIRMAGGAVKHAFRIENAGGEPVTVWKMYTSCMCTTAELVAGGKRFGPYGMPGHGFIPKINETIGAGERAMVEVEFDPAAHGPAGIGRIERRVTIENSGGRPLELGFSALVTP